MQDNRIGYWSTSAQHSYVIAPLLQLIEQLGAAFKVDYVQDNSICGLFIPRAKRVKLRFKLKKKDTITYLNISQTCSLFVWYSVYQKVIMWKLFIEGLAAGIGNGFNYNTFGKSIGFQMTLKPFGTFNIKSSRICSTCIYF